MTTVAVFVHVHDMEEMKKVDVVRRAGSETFTMHLTDDCTVFFPSLEALRDLKLKVELLIMDEERKLKEGVDGDNDE